MKAMRTLSIVLATFCLMGYSSAFGQQRKDRPYWPTGMAMMGTIKTDSLQLVGEGYYKSDRHVYIMNRADIGSARCVMVESINLIEGADPASFEFVVPAGVHGYIYTKDKNHVYFNGFLIAGADPESFEYLTYHYSKDKNHTFFENRAMEGIDTATFRIVPNDGWYPFAVDKSYLYFFHDKVKFDSKTFTKGEWPQVWQDKSYTYELNAGTYAPESITKKRKVFWRGS